MGMPINSSYTLCMLACTQSSHRDAISLGSSYGSSATRSKAEWECGTKAALSQHMWKYQPFRRQRIKVFIYTYIFTCIYKCVRVRVCVNIYIVKVLAAFFNTILRIYLYFKAGHWHYDILYSYNKSNKTDQYTSDWVYLYVYVYIT